MLMSRILFSVCFLLMFVGIKAQTDSVAVTADTCACGKQNLILDFVEQMPLPPGGWGEWHEYLMTNIRLTDSIVKGPWTGVVYITFIVDVNGNVCGSKIQKSSQSPEFDEQCLKLFNESAAWTPGKMNKEAVCVRMTLPVRVTPK